ncbi:MAG TPA: ribonuclease HII [Feifaniaceae bacterium]|nr:ribonuclease HII [Feifaniaceae bacterium]
MAKIAEAERLFALTEIERGFWQRPGIALAGMDEVGRGPLAGPVVSACVALPPEPFIEYVNDSKKLTEKRRVELAEKIRALSSGYAFGWVWPDVIDEINILQATRRAFRLAFENMSIPVTDVLVDALEGLEISARQHPFIHGDARSYLIAAASIVAKVERDAYMIEQDAIYPQYGFKTNKGYGTPEHIDALKAYGPCPIHRRSFLKKLFGEDSYGE